MLKDEINCFKIKQKGAGLGRRQAHPNELEVSSARTPESRVLAEESFASQEQTPSHPPPPAVPGDGSLSTASSSHPHRESGGKSLVDAISCLKASQFAERMGHQVTTTVSFEPKGLGFALLFGWGERTWQSQGGEKSALCCRDAPSSKSSLACKKQDLPQIHVKALGVLFPRLVHPRDLNQTKRCPKRMGEGSPPSRRSLCS